MDSPHDTPADTSRHDIAGAQQAIARAGKPQLRIEDVPLAKASGRVLAEILSPEVAAETPPAAGARLQSQHVPYLASLGKPTVRVFQRLKVGVLPLADSPECGLAGPMFAVLLDGMGVVAIAAPLVAGGAKAVGSVLDMLLKECRLVLVTGGPRRRAEVRAACALRGASWNDWQLCDELGAEISWTPLGDQIVVCLPSGLAESFMNFAVLVSPLIRRLQGRGELLPSSRAALVLAREGEVVAQGRFLWVRETMLRSQLLLHAQAAPGAIDVIAWADGVARSVAAAPDGGAVAVLYYPFSSWLR